MAKKPPYPFNEALAPKAAAKKAGPPAKHTPKSGQPAAKPPKPAKAPTPPAQIAPEPEEEAALPAFGDLGLTEPMLRAIADLGFEAPTPIQARSIPMLLAGRDLIGQAQTGTGKTAAFGLPLIQLTDVTRMEPQALVLEPTRELAVQVAGGIHALAKHTGLRVVPVYGGQPLDRQFRALREGARELGRMIRTVRENRDAAIFLASRMFYVDGMTAILIYSGIFAAGVMKWGALELLVYGIVLSVLAVLGGFVGRWLDQGVGPKNAVRIEIGMSLLGIIAVLGMGPDRILYLWHWSPALHPALWGGPFFRTLPEWIFLMIGFANAVFITAHYASSRTMLTRLTPPARTGAYFGVYALSGTATGWLGPLLVNQGTHIFKTQQGGFAMVTILLAIGFVGLFFVKGGGRRLVVPTE